MTTRKNVQLRISDVELFHECRDLLKKQLGSKLSDSLVVQAGLTALKTMHTEKLITIDEAAESCRRLSLPNICVALTQAIDLLGDARLLPDGEYSVEANKDTLKISIFKDGVIVEPLEPSEAEQPEWAAEMERKMAVN